MKKWFETTTKRLVWWLVLNSTVWIYLSYILAYLGRDDIAEKLSQAVVTNIIGTMMLYIISKTVENVFKHNDFRGVTKKAPVKGDTIKRDY